MANYTENFGLKKPEPEDFYDIEDFNGNMDILDSKVKSLDDSNTILKESMEILKSDVGTTKDTGGTTTAGSVFSKLNKLLTDWTSTRASRVDSIYNNTTTNNTASTTGTLSQKLSSVISTLSSILTNTTTNNTASTTGTLSQKLSSIISTISSILTNTNSIDSKIGTTTDTGGTSSAGSVFAKLNKLLTDWTSTRASRIDSIYTNTATNNTASTTGTISQKLSSAISTLSSILTNTSSSTTSSSTGTLSQKLNYLINQRQASLTGTGTTVYSSSTEITLPSTNSECVVVAKFIPPTDGVYKIVITYKKEDDEELLRGYAHFRKVENISASSYPISTSATSNISSIGSNPYVYKDELMTSSYFKQLPLLTEHYISTSNKTYSYSFQFNCRAGEHTTIVWDWDKLNSSGSSQLPKINFLTRISNVEITYQKR